MRLPIYIAIAEDVPPRSVLEDAGASVRQGTHGGWILEKGSIEVYAVRLGGVVVGGVSYDAYALLTVKGSQCKVWRYLKGQTGVNGPWTRHTAPAKLKQLLVGINSRRDIDGNVIAPGREGCTWVIAGDDADVADALTYTEGADPSGDDDEISANTFAAQLRKTI